MNTKYPFIVEFTGTAEAGKTTCIKTILERFSNSGLNVKYIQESAEIVSKSSIPKGSFEQHLSMRLLTLYNIINAKYGNYDLVLIDRGLLDGILYTIKFLSDNPSDSEFCSELIDFLDCLESKLSPDLFITFKVEPEIAIKRKGHEGSQVNHLSLTTFNNLMDEFVKDLSCPQFFIDTSNLSKEDVANTVYDFIRKKMEENTRA